MTKRPVQFILGSLALLGVLSVTMFWSTGMHQGGQHNCISAAIQNEVCPNASTPEAAVFHLNTLQSFISNGLQAWQFSGALLALAFIALAALTRFASTLAPSFAVRREATRSISPPGEYRRWLSLLEHSPSVSPGRV